MARRASFGLPILMKDLVEQAARPRTYVLRVVYAAALFVGGCFVFYLDADRAPNAAAQLGRGRELFLQLMVLQFCGVCLFFPGMACSAVTSEKERDCLALLIVSRLSPWEILIQKYLGRVLPMLSVLLLSLPLVAVAYSYGGVTPAQVFCAVYLLVILCLLIAAVGLLASSFFRTTAEAFIATYLTISMTFFCCALPVSNGVGPSATMDNAAAAVAASIPMLAFVAVLLGAARVALIDRAFVPPRNLLLIVFRAVDSVFNDANKLTGGVVLVRDANLLPGERPIAWRETAKKSLGTARYLFRVLTALMVPILFVGTFRDYRGYQQRHGETLIVFSYLLWGIAAALVSSHAAGLIASERSRQTLSVLLTTPLTARDIVLEKLAGVRRLIVVLCVPFTTIALFESASMPGDPWTNPALLIAAPLVYLPLVAWMSMAIGLRIASQSKAIMASMAAVVLWLVAPLAIHQGLQLFEMIWFSGTFDDPAERLLLVASPARLIVALTDRETFLTGFQTEAQAVARKSAQTVVAWTALASLGLHLAAMWALRQYCLTRADRWLGREPATPSRKSDDTTPSGS